jgi:hypothetical protein
VHGGERRHAVVVARAQAHDRLSLGEDRPRDRARELLVRLVADPSARGVHGERTFIVEQDDETPLGTQEIHRVVGDARRQPVEVDLTGQLAVDLEDPREPSLRGVGASSVARSRSTGVRSGAGMLAEYTAGGAAPSLRVP